VLTLALLCPDDVARAADDQKHVLLLHSARRDSVLAETGDREFSRLLDAALNGALDYFPEYIDTARFPDQKYRTAFRNFLRLKYKGQKFDLLVALENTSLDFASEIRSDLAPDAPIVYSASRRDLRRVPNSTGIVDEPDFTRTVRLALQLQPETTQLFVVSGASSRDKFYENLARTGLRSLEPSLRVTYLAGMTADDLEARARPCSMRWCRRTARARISCRSNTSIVSPGPRTARSIPGWKRPWITASSAAA
jgi:hypothetical protein